MKEPLKNIVWHEGTISRKERTNLLGRPNRVLWFTGLSASGKSTIARALEKELFERKIASYVLDGDNIRHGLNSDLGFSEKDRTENIRRIGEVAKLFYDAGLFVIVAFISPFREDRARARSLVGEDFAEIYVKCSIEECERRDPKGMYKKARRGEIREFTGIDQAYQIPERPGLTLETDRDSVDDSVRKILSYLSLS